MPEILGQPTLFRWRELVLGFLLMFLPLLLVSGAVVCGWNRQRRAEFWFTLPRSPS